MLNFYINRAGSGLPAKRKAVLQRAKEELRREFHKASALPPDSIIRNVE
jgi:hypothetical protein